MFNMMKTVRRYSTFSLVFYLFASVTQAGEGFNVIALGVWGGIKDGNLSAYMIQPHGDTNSVTCDAGTLINGIDVAVRKGNFNTTSLAEDNQYNLQVSICTLMAPPICGLMEPPKYALFTLKQVDY